MSIDLHTQAIIALQQKPLINARELNNIITHDTTPNLLLLDVRSIDKFTQGHIPHAIHTDYKKWRITYHNIRDLLPNPTDITALFQSLGIRKDSYVVIIGGIDENEKKNDFATTTRVYWTIKTAGNNNVSILDGGFRSWEAEQFAVSTDNTTPQSSDWNITEFDDTWLSLEHHVQDALQNSDTALLDSRPSDYYHGYLKATLKKGSTIDRSINLPKGEFINSNGTLKSPQAINEILQQHNINDEKKYIHFCNTGHMASATWFVFSELLEIPSTLYDASLVEWTLNENNPTKNKKSFFKIQAYRQKKYFQKQRST